MQNSNQPQPRQSLEQQIKTIASKDLTERKTWYSPAAEHYNRTRPGYAQIHERVAEVARLTPNSRVLEVGCGPGTATVAFAPLGCSMTCLEPNLDFCQIARQNCASYPNVEICNTSFEEWALETERFDAVLAATSFHWVPAEIAYPKAVSALKPNGCLILLWNVIAEPGETVYRLTHDLYQTYAPALAPADSRELQQTWLSSMAEIVRETGYFKQVEADQISCERTYSTEDYLTLLSTLSPYLSLDPQVRAALFADMKARLDREGSTVQLDYLSAFQIAWKS
jgi:SAM-dependent methyltransferase